MYKKFLDDFEIVSKEYFLVYKALRKNFEKEVSKTKSKNLLTILFNFSILFDLIFENIKSNHMANKRSGNEYVRFTNEILRVLAKDR